jgi:glucosyl-dolichyl phosphate glucuronosyltransferase
MLTIRLTVVVCTRDRADLLAGCLDRLARQQAEAGGVEVIVVDNGSRDGTADLLATATNVRAVVEPVAGLSRARNRGLEAATGELVAFLDDDARPETGWARALTTARHRFPSATAFGGPVALEWLGSRPAWLGRGLERWYSAVDHGPTPRLLDPDERPVGTNMAVVRRAAIDAGGFALELGRHGTSLGSEEEVELLTRMLRDGGAIGWLPEARVRHLVPAARARRRWLLHRAWAQGRSDAIAARLAGEPTSAASELTAAVAALFGRWSGLRREAARASDLQAAVLQDIVRRTRRLGRVAQALSGRGDHDRR